MTAHVFPPAGGARRLAALVSSSGPLGLKRTIVLAVFVPGLVLLQLLHRIGFALDYLFFPGLRRVEVREIFVIDRLVLTSRPEKNRTAAFEAMVVCRPPLV